MKEDNTIFVYNGFITAEDKKPVMVVNYIDVLEHIDTTAIVSVIKKNVTLGTATYKSSLFGGVKERITPSLDTAIVYAVNLSNGRTIYLNKNPLEKIKRGRPSKKAKEEQTNG